MLDIGWSEMAVIALLALVVIGPKDLPRVMRSMGKWAHKARAISLPGLLDLWDLVYHKRHGNY